MAERTIKTKLLVRTDTTANWESENPILQANEFGFDSTVQAFKKGDGTTTWNSLDYVTDIRLANKTEIANANERIYLVIGNTSGTAGTWTGTNERITSYFDGLLINYKIGIAGASTTTLNINGLGAKTIYLRGTTKLTTHYEVGTMVLLSYNSSKGAFYSADYDANSYAYVRQYTTTTSAEYPMLMAYETTIPSSYDTKYVRKNSTIKANPSTGTITATTFKGSLNGNATSSTKATQDGNGNEITETYATKQDLENLGGGSSGGTSYPIIDLDDNGLMLDDEPSGTTTQEKINQIIQAGGFYYGNQYFAPLILVSVSPSEISLVSRTDYVEDGYSDLYQMFINTDTKEYYTVFNVEVTFSQYYSENVAKKNNDNTFIGDNTFEGITTIASLNASNGVGTNGQVLTSTGSGVKWTTPSSSGGSSGTNVNFEPIEIEGTISSELDEFVIDVNVTQENYNQYISNKLLPIKIGNYVFQLCDVSHYDSEDYCSYVFHDAVYTRDCYVAIGWVDGESYCDETYISTSVYNQFIDISSGIRERHVKLIKSNPTLKLRDRSGQVFTPTYYNDDFSNMRYISVSADENIIYWLDINWERKVLNGSGSLDISVTQDNVYEWASEVFSENIEEHLQNDIIDLTSLNIDLTQSSSGTWVYYGGRPFHQRKKLKIGTETNYAYLNYCSANDVGDNNYIELFSGYYATDSGVKQIHFVLYPDHTYQVTVKIV